MTQVACVVRPYPWPVGLVGFLSSQYDCVETFIRDEYGKAKSG